MADRLMPNGIKMHDENAVGSHRTQKAGPVAFCVAGLPAAAMALESHVLYVKMFLGETTRAGVREGVVA